MAFVPVANTVMAEIIYLLHGQVCENTLYFELAAPASQAELEQVAIDLDGWVTSALMPDLSNNLLYTGLRITALDSQSAPGIEYPRLPVLPGGVNSPALPGNVAVTISFKTPLRGRSYRGRNFLPGVSDAAIDGNTVTAGALQSLLANYNTLNAAMVESGGIHVVVSRYSGVDADGKPIPRAAGVTTPVTSYVADPFVDSQRRRLTGRGN